MSLQTRAWLAASCVVAATALYPVVNYLTVNIPCCPGELYVRTFFSGPVLLVTGGLISRFAGNRYLKGLGYVLAGIGLCVVALVFKEFANEP